MKLATPSRSSVSQRPESREELQTPLGIYLREIGKESMVTVVEENELAERIKQGDEEARERLITANLRLVVKIARDYEHFGLPLLDLINEGNIGLMKAAERFDPAKGAKFSTYSSWWIKQGIKRALANQSKTIRIPVHLVDKIAHMRKLSLRMREQLGREPNNEELAAEMGISVKRVAMMRRAALRPTSLDAPVVDDENRELAETVADENAVDAFDELNRKSREDQIHRFLDHLDERELEILNRRFGLDGRQAQTLEDIGEFFGVTRERIRQIQNHALNKLRQLMEREDSVQFSC